MPDYTTYMEVSLNSEGSPPADVTTALKQLGWKPCYGQYDYAFKWGSNWGDNDNNIDNYFDYMNKVHNILKGHHVNYSLRTFESGKENFWVKWGP